jgi:hypothetical protein
MSGPEMCTLRRISVNLEAVKFDCMSISKTDGQNAYISIKDIVWSILGIAPYGLLFAGIFLIFGSITGRI